MIHPLWIKSQFAGDHAVPMADGMNISLAMLKLPLGIAYFVAASAALTLTSFHGGGVAFLWVACALLIADLVRTRRSRWLYSIVPCVIASGLATGLFGLGWQVAPLFCLLNAAEAVIAAWLIRRTGQGHKLLGSLTSLWQFVLAAGIVAPLMAAAMAGIILSWMGRPAIDGMVDVATGHALGNITFTPLALLFTRRSGVAQTRRGGPDPDRRNGRAAAADGGRVGVGVHATGPTPVVPADPARNHHCLSPWCRAHGHCRRPAGADRERCDLVRHGTG
jgi:hypothetical protein